VSFTLDDSTGQYEARHWIASSSIQDDNEQSDRFGEIEQVLCFSHSACSDDKIRQNASYVRVTGALKSFGNLRYINAQHVHLVKDPHEPYFHLLDCLYTSLALERGLVRTSKWIALSGHLWVLCSF
jgi:replication factor A2